MRGYSEAVKADVRRRMSRRTGRAVPRISEELGIHSDHPLQIGRKTGGLQGEVVPASEKEPNGWSRCRQVSRGAGDRWPECTELKRPTAGSGACFPSRWSVWRQAGQDANAKPVLDDGRAEKEARKARAQEAARDKALKKSCSARERPWRKMAAFWCCEKVGGLLLRRTAEG